MKIIVTFLLAVAATLAEPPVDNRYLPPQQGFGGSSGPSQTYGTPGSSSGSQRQTTATFRPRLSNTYGTPGIQRSNFQRPSNQYLGPSNQYSGSSELYGSPRSQSGIGGQIPSAQYSLSSPSQQYGAPGFENGQSGSFEGAQARQYLPPGRGGYSDDGSNGEPANYSFEYMVQDDASGNDFGHREARQGDRSEGLYYVLLPDGRKQTVEYEADQDGYRPRISYQDTGLVAGGYGRGNQGYSNRYPEQGPY
ncbi:pro-resilin-like [Battus philenor]|uniref:pro-resilin-like n=1 Tax=Battus philenor TaxID=42288 RepID=UPI0035D039CB